eukprot:s1332_g2.t1
MEYQLPTCNMYCPKPATLPDGYEHMGHSLGTPLAAQAPLTWLLGECNVANPSNEYRCASGYGGTPSVSCYLRGAYSSVTETVQCSTITDFEGCLPLRSCKAPEVDSCRHDVWACRSLQAGQTCEVTCTPPLEGSPTTFECPADNVVPQQVVLGELPACRFPFGCEEPFPLTEGYVKINETSYICDEGFIGEAQWDCYLERLCSPVLVLSKFGPLFADLRCELCCLSFRLQDILHSERFPEIGGKFLTPDLRGVYYKALEICDAYARGAQGGKGPPGPEEKGPEAPIPEELQSTTPKAKPPVKEEPTPTPRESTGVKEEREIEEKPPQEERKDCPEDSRRERKRRESREEPRERARSSGTRRRRERSRSSRQRRRASKERKPRRGESRDPRKGIVGPGQFQPTIDNPKAKGAPAAPRGVLRRPARAEEAEDRGGPELSETLEEGREVEAHRVGLASWRIGKRLVVTEGTYWEEPVKVAGILKGLRLEEEQAFLSFKIEGTQSEALVKWVGAHPSTLAELHICRPDCVKMSKDGLVHVNKVLLPKVEEKEPWMENLVEVRKRPEEEEDELRRLREHSRRRTPEEIRELDTPVGAGKAKSSSSSEDERKKKKKKKKKKEDKEKLKIVATKDLTAVFGTTALDPRPPIRKRVKKRARRAAKKRGRRGDSDSTSSPGTSSGSEDTAEETGHLFGEEVKVKMVGKRFPGALTLSTVEVMQTAVVSQSGQPWQLDRSSLPPIFTQYWRMMLSGKMTGAMNREAQTLCYLQDLLLQGRVATACDTITQRLKGLEQVADGSHYLVAQRQELVPLEKTAMTTPMESLEATRLQREEAKAKASAARPWVRNPEWENRGGEMKGKGKTKDSKGKGKTKGDRSGAPREDRDKEKK